MSSAAGATGARLDPNVPLTLLHGDATLLIERAAEELVRQLLPPDELDYGLTRLNLVDTPVEAAIEELSAGCLMAPRRVVVLRHVNALPAAQQKRLLPALCALAPDTSCVLTAPTDNTRSRGEPVCSDLAKLLRAQGQVAEFRTPWERELVPWCSAEAQRLGHRLDLGAAQRLVDLVGRNHQFLSNELRKLGVYVGPGAEIALGDVDQLVSPTAEANSFDFADALAARDAPAALEALLDLLPARNPSSAAIMLLGMIARQYRLVWQTRYLAGHRVEPGGRVPAELAAWLPARQKVSDAARSSFVARKLSGQARHFHDAQLARALALVLDADRTLKGQTEETLHPRVVLEALIADLCAL